MARRHGYFWMSKVLAALLGMLAAAPGFAAIYTVGPSGSYSTLQAALDAAAASPEDDQLRLEAAVFSGAAAITVNSVTGSLIVSGGWNSSFSELIASGNAFNATVVNANETDIALRATVSAGSLELYGFRLSYGSAPSNQGGNIEANVSGGELRLFDMHFRNGSGSNVGAGGQFNAFGSGSIRCQLCSFANNSINASSGSYFGVGARLVASQSGLIDFNEVEIFANQGGSAPFARGLGLDVDARDGSLIQLSDISIVNNHTATSGGGSMLSITARGNALVNSERLTLTSNSGPAGNTVIRQVAVDSYDTAQVYLTDSLIADSALTGIGAVATAGNGIHFNNLTVAQNGGAGVEFSAFPGGAITLYNSIVHGNGLSSPAGTASGNNLGANLGLAAPTFVASGNYRLAPGSRGVDEGSASVPGGLGLLDLDRQTRVSGANVDIGAYEQVADVLYASGFEGGAR